MAAPTDPAEPTRTVIEQAAAWHAQLADEDGDEADRAAFADWLDEAPSHRVAFDRMDAIAGRIGRQGMASPGKVSRMRRGVFTALLLGGVGLLGWSAAKEPVIRARIADERTAIGEIREAAWRSGDRLTLDSDSAADVDAQRRSVRLWRGAVLAQVQPGRSQPFIVATPQGTAKALGTRFTVRVEDGKTIIAVMESRVEACAAVKPVTCLILSPGQSARLDSSGAHRMADVDTDAASAWSDGLLIADDLPLATVLDALNRYRPDPLIYAAREIDGLRVTGTFPLADADRALASIAAALPVTVDQAPDGLTVHRRQK